MPVVEEPTEAFTEFTQNIEYAKRLVSGGERLAQLRVGAFDVDDLYRAAWVQAVAALDHWVTREIVERAVRLAENPNVERPTKFSTLKMPVELFERIHHHDQPLSATFREHLEQTFGYMTFQNPDKIKEGFAHVSKTKLWPKVAEAINRDRTPSDQVTAEAVQTKVRQIAARRNRIAHTADRNLDGTGRAAITAAEAHSAIDWLTLTAEGIVVALGKPPSVPTQETPEGVDDIAEAAADAAGSTFAHAGPGAWDKESLFRQIEKTCTADVADLLMTVYRHAEQHPFFSHFYFGESKNPSATAWFAVGDDESAAVWSIYTDDKKSVLAINFQWMRDRTTLAKRLAPLANTLSSLPGLRDLPRDLVARNYMRRPSLGHVTLSAPSAKHVIVGSIDDLLRSRKRRLL
ncbi:hypothetical protein [Actinoallomurus iriomotensis]|uniref:RiboL-PSP-HEPN domain-containing protein n=1 Tax=Actinoallomurus iriomotensis TaxID=478107 RepID=A0A9W6VWK0_9ACTN|nr:hypothetical protein [Actinoallomurus iriomotensis]GLY82314.1 hypothetical protein Airi02_002460 [Actinoallomurus iriomotensis]